MAKTASLTSGLVAKKGQAMPAVPRQADEHAPTAVTHPVEEAVRVGFKPVGSLTKEDYYKALTVKLDRERYEALKTLGIKLDKPSQEIFVEALDLYLREVTQQA
jgi:hypothetical protein